MTEVTIKQTTLAKKKVKHMTLRQLNQPKVSSTDVYIMGDISGSMSGHKLEALKRAFNDCWKDGIHGVVFSNDVYLIAQRDIHTLPASGGTAMLAALRAVWNEEPTHIILITDGMPTDCSTDELLHNAEAYKHIPIDTIGISEEGYPCDYSFLQQLSKLTGGSYNSCTDTLKLSYTVQELLKLQQGNPVAEGAIQL